MFMRTRASELSIPLLLGVALCFPACAPQPATQAAAARPAEPPPAKPPKLAKPKRADPNCAAARIDLSAARKEALFRQFEAEIGPAVPPTAVVTDPDPVPRCKQASK